jgi:hypothetical protein
MSTTGVYVKVESHKPNNGIDANKFFITTSNEEAPQAHVL